MIAPYQVVRNERDKKINRSTTFIWVDRIIEMQTETCFVVFDLETLTFPLSSTSLPICN